jgi:hypothetical protein
VNCSFFLCLAACRTRPSAWVTNPALRPVRALLIRVPLGPRPWLRRLRHDALSTKRLCSLCFARPAFSTASNFHIGVS